MDIKKILLETINEVISENEITPPNIPNTMNFWHGGNLDEYNDTIAQKNGRYEYGPGLYLTDHYETARKYSKGSRKFYLVTVENGVDINNAYLPVGEVKHFINTYIIKRLRVDIWNRIQKFINDETVKAYNFNVIVLNEKAIKPSDTQHLRQLYIDNGIDYEIVDNAFGWGEKMMVLYNMKKIKNIINIKPTDKISNYNL